jgi:MFS family permease
VPATDRGPVSDVDTSTVPVADERRHRSHSGFWAAAFAFLIVLAVWKDLPGLLIGRLVTGVAVGLAAGTAITYLIELRLRADPKASAARARTIGTALTVGALGIGPLIAGCLTQWVSYPLTVPYLVFIALGAVALACLLAAPETGAPAPRAAARTRAAGPRHTVRLPVPAAAGTLAAFSANGLFAGLSGLFLVTTFHHPSHALSGAALFLVFAAGVASQLATGGLPASRVLALGTAFILTGLVLLIVSVRLSIPDLALFLIAGALIGAGSGAVFKGTTGIVLEASPPESRVAMTSDLLIALYVGLSVPVIGAGVALDLGARAPKHRARVRHPRRAWRRRHGLATARAPRVAGPPVTGRRQEMSLDFATIRVQEVAS